MHLELDKFGKDNVVTLWWILAHKGHTGNEKADSLSKENAENSDFTSVQLQVPKTIV